MTSSEAAPFRLHVLATGGTIEKSYDASAGCLTLDTPVIEALLSQLDQPDIAITVSRLMSIDSLDMRDSHRQRVVTVVTDLLAADGVDAVLITHGTDTLAKTADALRAALGSPSRPVVLTGAMRPFRVADSDALQNVAQAIVAARLLPGGVYAVFHGRVIAAGAIAKDYERLTLVEVRSPVSSDSA